MFGLPDASAYDCDFVHAKKNRQAIVFFGNTCLAAKKESSG